MANPVSLETLVAFAKRRGFIFQGSEIYGGLAGTWDLGPYGVALKLNLKRLWWEQFVDGREDMYGVDTTILMNSKVWEASGHTGAGFTDPLVEDLVTKKRFRADHLLEDAGHDVAGLSLEQISAKIQELGLKSPDGNALSEARQFNMMFSTKAGAIDDTASHVYLRPETAQGMFTNFKGILDTMRPTLPFGLAQAGKAFRNEITPRDFIFRSREFEIMELEYFIHPSAWEATFEMWLAEMYAWMERIGLNRAAIHELEVAAEDRAHYSKRTVDFEYDFPFGRKELYGLAYRTDHDLKGHMALSGTDMTMAGEDGEKFVPHVIEPTFGVERTMLAVIATAYEEQEVKPGDTRVVLHFKPEVAPVKVAVSPLLRNKPELVAKAREVYASLRKDIGAVMFDDNGNIGKRYRRQDELGTPLCVVIDFESLDDNAVTIRHRDTMEQTRVAIADLPATVRTMLDAF